jgi:hypothetical protein
MWKACRDQERKIQGIMHDHKKRAERKAAYFAEKVRLPPSSEANLLVFATSALPG